MSARLIKSALEAEAVAVAIAQRGAWRAAVVDGIACQFIEAPAGSDAPIDALPATDLVHNLADADADLSVLLPGATNVIVAPFGSGGVILVAFGGGPRHQLPASMVAVVEQAGRLVESAVDRARLNAELERLATTDALTGLPNRRLFEDALHREVERSRRTGEQFSLVILDVDHFKRVNDQHGHDAGDAVLWHFGCELAGAARDADLPARFGGEEFVVLMSGCDERAALAAADRLRRAAVAGDAPLPISASAGVATFGVHAHDGAALFAAADAALYDAKRGGRDRVCAAGPKRRLVAVAS